MDKRKAIWIWGLLIALLLIMVVVEIKPGDQDKKIAELFAHIDHFID